MRVRRLELTNFRMFRKLVIEDPGDTVILVSPNGLGKSTILEAIVAAHDLVGPYHQSDYPYMEQYQSRKTRVWPHYLPSPVRNGETEAEVILEVAANADETKYLTGVGLEASTGTVRLVLRDGRYVPEVDADDVAKSLFEYHTPSDGVGFVDYIRPIRIHTSGDLGDVMSAASDGSMRNSLSEFPRNWTEHQKFGRVPTFLAHVEVSDLLHQKDTGEVRDSLSDFSDVFDYFFAPKKYMGIRLSPPDKPRVLIETPFGDMEPDDLSSGEKEMLSILGHLFQVRDLESVVLWDTPELHLNAALESRLYDAVRRVAPHNQYWMATHSLELINAVPLDSVYVIRSSGDEAVVERASGEPQKAKVAIYQELGAQVGLQLVSACVVFCEGKEAHADKRHLERLVGQRVPGVTFVAGGSCGTVLSAGSRAHDLLQQATTNGDFLAVVDRDFRSGEQVAEIEEKHGGRVFVWAVHEIENLLLDPQIIHHALVFHDQLEGLESEEAVRASLDEAASRIAERIAAQWTAWQFSQAFPRAGNVAPADDPLDSLLRHAEALQPKLAELADPAAIKDAYQTRLDDVREIIAAGEACTRLPGKEILSSFLHEHTSLSREQFVSSAVTVVCEKGIAIGEIDRLMAVLRDAIGLKQE